MKAAKAQPWKRSTQISSLSAIGFSRDASIDLFGEFATLEVADALHPLAGDVTIKAPELGFFVGDLLAMPRLAPSELADAVLFLCSPAGKKITGELIAVSGNLEWED